MRGEGEKGGGEWRVKGGGGGAPMHVTRFLVSSNCPSSWTHCCVQNHPPSVLLTPTPTHLDTGGGHVVQQDVGKLVLVLGQQQGVEGAGGELSKGGVSGQEGCAGGSRSEGGQVGVRFGCFGWVMSC
jgi:hypothetical protein